MVIMYDTGASGSAYSSLSAEYGGQYTPPITSMGHHTGHGEFTQQRPVDLWKYPNNQDNIAAVSNSSGSVLGLPVVGMTSYPTSCQVAYSYPSLASGLGASGMDLPYPATNPLAADIVRVGVEHTLPRLPGKSAHHPYYWRKKTVDPPEGMTRTRDKYRVVYTTKQRAGLEREYNNNKFLTCARRSEISKSLDLSERQIKIWFQNRRAKERRQSKRIDETNRVSSPESHHSPSGISVNEGEHSAGSAISPENRYMGGANSESAHHQQFVTHAQYYQIPMETCMFPLGSDIAAHADKPRENIRPSCKFAFNRGSAYTDHRLERPSITPPTSKTQGDIDTCLVPPTGFMPPFHHHGNKSFSTSPTEWQTNNRLMTSYNISPIGTNSDINAMYRV